MENLLVLAVWLLLGLPEDWFEKVPFLGSLGCIHIAMVDICVYRFTYVQVLSGIGYGLFWFKPESTP